jgi:hypothetical protein
MHHVVHAVDDTLAYRRLGEIGFDEFDFPANALQPIDVAGAKVVDDAHLLAVFD